MRIDPDNPAMRRAMFAAVLAVALFPLHRWRCIVCGLGFYGHNPSQSLDRRKPYHWHAWVLTVEMIPMEIENAG